MISCWRLWIIDKCTHKIVGQRLLRNVIPFILPCSPEEKYIWIMILLYPVQALGLWEQFDIESISLRYYWPCEGKARPHMVGHLLLYLSWLGLFFSDQWNAFLVFHLSRFLISTKVKTKFSVLYYLVFRYQHSNIRLNSLWSITGRRILAV